jgi:hypothetical protein
MYGLGVLVKEVLRKICGTKNEKVTRRADKTT